MHSLHAYFLRRGDFNSAHRLRGRSQRDGKHFATGVWSPSSTGEQIFNMSASFQIAEKRASSIRSRCRRCRRPIRCRTWIRTFAALLATVAAEPRGGFSSRSAPSSSARCIRRFLRAEDKTAPVKYIWFRAVDRLPDDESPASQPAGLSSRISIARYGALAAWRPWSRPSW